MLKTEGAVPDTFSLSLKASQRITPLKTQRDGAGNKYFLETAAVLGEQLGVVLVQTPPNMKKESASPRALSYATAPMPRRPSSFGIPPGLMMTCLNFCAAKTGRWSFRILTICRLRYR